MQAYRRDLPGQMLGMDIDPAIDQVGLARAFGVKAESVSNAEELTVKLRSALRADEPVLLDVAVETAVGRLR
jgi:thiamine pyrophosphate-dependent acetolactate synthase large subunit-like protein